MDPLNSDPRTARLGGGWSARRELAKVAPRLLGELRADERVSWVAMSGALRPVLAVLTDQRLLAIPTSAGQPVRAVDAPFRVTARKPRMVSTALEISGHDGGVISLVMLPDDVARIDEAAGRSTDGAFSRAPAVPADFGPRTPPAAAPAPPLQGSDAAWGWGRPVLS